MLTPFVCKLCALQQRLEWGDPLACSDAWHCIRSYSPYDNLDDAWVCSSTAYCPDETGDPAEQVKAPLATAAWKETAGEGEAAAASGGKHGGSPEGDGFPAAERAPHRHGGPKPGSSFPHLLLTASLHDPRVPYHEPAKYVAKLRALASGWSATGGRICQPLAGSAHEDSHRWSAASGGDRVDEGGGRPLVLFLTTMAGGHGGASSGRLGERADKCAFLLSCLDGTLQSQDSEQRASVRL